LGNSIIRNFISPACAWPAALEYRHWGVLIKSLYISEEIAGAKTIADHWRENLGCLTGVEGRLKKRVVLRKLARLFKSLHEQRIYTMISRHLMFLSSLADRQAKKVSG
jgi:hypothetical protein